MEERCPRTYHSSDLKQFHLMSVYHGLVFWAFLTAFFAFSRPHSRRRRSQISSLIESLAAETHFASYFENVGVDIGHVARSISGRTAGELVEGVKMTADKVGAQAQRLRTEALRWRKV